MKLGQARRNVQAHSGRFFPLRQNFAAIYATHRYYIISYTGRFTCIGGPYIFESVEFENSNCSRVSHRATIKGRGAGA